MQYASEPSHAEPVSLLDVRELSFSWPTGQKALDDVTFSLEASERVGLVGPSGAGKSTLLLHLNGLLPESLPTSAENDATVSVNGLAVSRANVNAIRQQVGLLFQDPLDQLFSPTVRDDVAFGPRNLGRPESEVQRCVTMSLGRVGLSDYEDRSPLQLSTGEQKRVCLAGVLACGPTMLALDEPSSSLDPRARRGLIKVLKEFSGAMIVASHDLEFVLEICDRVLVLDKGRVQRDGPSRELLSDQRLMERHGLEVPLSIQFDSNK